MFESDDSVEPMRPQAARLPRKIVSAAFVNPTVQNRHSCQRVVSPWLASVTLALLAVAGGCGDGKPAPLKVYPVNGSVKFDGKAIEGAILTFTPKSPDFPEDVRPTASSDAEGNFKIRTYSENDGAPEGDYDVTVTWSPLVKQGGSAFPGPNRLPDRYSKRDSSQLTVHVNAEPTELKTIELTR